MRCTRRLDWTRPSLRDVRGAGAVILLLALLGAGVAWRHLSFGAAVDVLDCAEVAGLASGDDVVVLCLDDERLASCVGRRAGRVHRTCEPAEPLPGAVLLMYGLPIEVNAATADDLRALAGIGQGLAERMVEGRRAGPYCAPADLERVTGLGSKRVEALSRHLSFDSPLCAPEARR